MYQLQKNLKGEVVSIWHQETLSCIPIDPANTDYQTFKAQINDESAQLEDADGNLMTAQQAINYVATLP